MSCAEVDKREGVWQARGGLVKAEGLEEGGKGGKGCGGGMDGVWQAEEERGLGSGGDLARRGYGVGDVRDEGGGGTGNQSQGNDACDVRRGGGGAEQGRESDVSKPRGERGAKEGRRVVAGEDGRGSLTGWDPSRPSPDHGVLSRRPIEQLSTTPPGRLNKPPSLGMSGYIYCLVQRAEDVLVADARGTSDCFVRAFMEGHMKNAKETSVIPKSLNPVWDTVLSIPRPKAGQEAQTLMLEVFDHDWNGKDLLGFATVDVSSLKDGEMREEILDLQWREGVKLTYSSERPSSRGLGRLYVRVGTGEDKNPSKELLKAVEVCSTAELTKVPEGLLLSSAKRLGVSGGTAPFFSLTLSPEHQTAGCPADFFVGKDLSRSEAEAPFYDEILAILKSADLGNDPDGLGELLKFAFQYEGIFTTQEAPTNDAPPSDDQTVDLLVLQNLRCGAGKLRLLDIKMGEKTASPGWQGKSSSAAQRQAIVDSITNSSAEGFRLEGFDGAPESLVSMNPLVDVPSAFKGLLGSEKMEKKARRIMMQRLSAADVLSHFLALSEPGVAELQEVLLHESISKLSALAVACRKVRVPQKWVGSSVAIGFDAASSWTGDEAAARAQVIVKIFDWGRSELNVASKYSVMTAAERSDRIEFWRNYRMGMNKLSFEAARFYHHRFNSTDPFPNLRVRVWDFDSLTDNDLIGSTELRLEPSASSVTVPLFLSTSAKDKPCGSLTYAIQWVEASPSSRLAGWWRVTLEKAEGLPAMDLSGTSDPLATLTATSRDGSFRTTWQTRVIERELNPTWNESFEVPVARPGTRRLAEALETGPGLGAASELPSPEHFASILPAPIMIHDEEEVSKTNNRLVSMACFGAWNELLDSIQPQTIFEALE